MEGDGKGGLRAKCKKLEKGSLECGIHPIMHKPMAIFESDFIPWNFSILFFRNCIFIPSRDPLSTGR